MTKRQRDVKREVTKVYRLLQRATRKRSLESLPSESHGSVLLAALMIVEVVAESMKGDKQL